MAKLAMVAMQRHTYMCHPMTRDDDEGWTSLDQSRQVSFPTTFLYKHDQIPVKDVKVEHARVEKDGQVMNLQGTFAG